MTVSNPCWLQNKLFPAIQDRQVLDAIAGGVEQIVGSASLLPSLSSGVTTSVAAGSALVKGDTNARQGFYLFECTASENQAHTRDATNPRINRVVARVYDSEEVGSGSDGGAIEIVAGIPTPGADLTNLSGIAALPASAMPIANVLVPVAGDATLTDARPKSVITSPTITGWRSVGRVSSSVFPGVTAAHYALRQSAAIVASAADMSSSPAEVMLIRLEDFLENGKSPKFRLRGIVSPNNTSTDVTFTFGLYPVVPVNGANIALTLGTVWAGSTAAIIGTGLVAPSSDKALSTEFDIDTVFGGNYYVLGVQLSGTVATSAKAILTADLQVRYI